MFNKDTDTTFRQHKIHFYRQIAFTFIGAAIVVLIGLIYFSLSQAVITVTPALETAKADFNLLVKTDEEMTEEGVPAQLVMTQVTVERTSMAEIQEEGEAQQATGTATLINTSNSPQPLVATTRLLSEEGVLFRIRSGTTVPANGEVEAEVYADQPGKQGEIGPTRFTIPGLNEARQQEVYATSDSPMTGGTRSTYLITEASVDKAIEEAKAQIVQSALESIAADGVNTDELIADASHVEILSQEVDPEVGAQQQDFTVSLVAQVAFVKADESNLLDLAQAQLYTNANIGYELSSSDEGSFTYEITNFDPENGQAQLHIVLEGQRRISSNHPVLDASNFVGMKPAEVKAELEADSGIREATVELRPFWLRRVPRLVDHIYIQFAG